MQSFEAFAGEVQTTAAAIYAPEWQWTCGGGVPPEDPWGPGSI
jgi:hypothetical protein